MKLEGPRLRQRDSTTCGPTVAVVAGALLDPAYRGALTGSPRSWFDNEQLRIHAEVNRLWPRMLGTTPMGIARAVTARTEVRGVRYRWRLFVGRRDRLADVLSFVADGWPVAMLVGRFMLMIPVLAIAGSLARKQTVPVSAGTFPTNTGLFSALLTGVVVIVVGLTYFPVVALGPIVEHLVGKF